MKKFLFLTATLCILLTVGINAQQKGPRERMTPEQRAEANRCAAKRFKKNVHRIF